MTKSYEQILEERPINDNQTYYVTFSNTPDSLAARWNLAVLSAIDQTEINRIVGFFCFGNRFNNNKLITGIVQLNPPPTTDEGARVFSISSEAPIFPDGYENTKIKEI